MTSSPLQVAEAVAEHEMRTEQGQHAAPRGPGQAVGLVHADAARPQRPQGLAAAFSAATRRDQDDAERAVEHTEAPPHLTQLSREALQGKTVNFKSASKSAPDKSSAGIKK